MWLYGEEHQVTEAGTMNFFVSFRTGKKTNKTLVAFIFWGWVFTDEGRCEFYTSGRIRAPLQLARVLIIPMISNGILYLPPSIRYIGRTKKERKSW